MYLFCKVLLYKQLTAELLLNLLTCALQVKANENPPRFHYS